MYWKNNSGVPPYFEIRVDITTLGSNHEEAAVAEWIA